MSSFYVDFENVGSLGMDGISLLTDADTVFIFYSNKADTMKMNVVAQIYQTSARIIFEKVELGTPNALDFQLLTDLFCKIQNTQGKSYIISKDTGYDVAVKRGRSMYNYELWRKTSIRKAIESVKHSSNEPASVQKNVVESVLDENGFAEPDNITNAESMTTKNGLNEETALIENEVILQQDVSAVSESNEKGSFCAEEAAESAVNEPEAQKNQASEEPAITAEVREKQKRSKNRTRKKITQRKKENHNTADSANEADFEHLLTNTKTEMHALHTAKPENNALLTRPVPMQLIVFDQKAATKFQKHSGSQHSDNRKKNSKPGTSVSMSEEIKNLLKSQCDMNITEAECAIIIKAAGSSNNRGEFYHFFRREMGDANGREFYLKIRGYFDSIKKLTKKYD